MNEVVPWPWPGDTDLEKRERIARDYRNELFRIAPAVCAGMDAAAHRLGQHWITPEQVTFDLEAHVDAATLAEYVGLSIDAIYQWASRGHITRYHDHRGRTVYLVKEAVDYQADLRTKRIEREMKRRSKLRSGRSGR